MRAAEYANANGGVTIGLTGFDGGRLRKICQVYVHVETPAGEYGPVEDIHLVMNHLITSYLHCKLGALVEAENPGRNEACGGERVISR